MKRLPPSSIDPANIASSLSVPTDSWMVFQCKLVTPLYGGGVVAGEVDKDMPIRATAIRGQLRFWWRLLNRDPSKTTAELFNTERAIWGGLGNSSELEASKVKVRVRDVTPVTAAACAIYPPGKNYPTWEAWAHPYALFPAQGRAKSGRVVEEPKKLVINEPSFQLLVSMPPETEFPEHGSVLEAIRWWATFGGIGARTRRGLGTVWITGVQNGPSIRPVSQEEVQQKHMHLVFCGQPQTDPITAWKIALDKFRDFRQGVGIGRNPGNQRNRPGRSRWPEPNAIRKITGIFRIKKDGTSFRPSAKQPILFPRAAFGLPIIFHFQKMDNDQQPDPPDVTLTAMEMQNGEYLFYERMASPILLRPYPVGQNQWRAAALVLPRQPIKDLYLEWDSSGRRIVAPDWLPKKANQQQTNPPVPPMAGFADPIAAFVQFFSKMK